VILAQEVSRVVGLTVDYDVDNGNRICWADSDLHQIACCNIEGKNFQRLTISPTPFATAMAVLDGNNHLSCHP